MHKLILVMVACLPVMMMLLAADRDVVVQGNTQFAFDLYNQIKKGENKDQNIFFSPVSISTALAMAYAGARGETEKQMAQTLHFSLPQQKLHPAFSELLSGLKGNTNYELAIANRLWGQKDYKFSGDFIALVDKDYQGGLQLMDFPANPESCRKTINQWIEDKTKQKIKDLLHSGDIQALTRLVLTNAIYFKGNWTSKFDPKSTADAPFTQGDSKNITAPLMSQTGNFSFFEDDLLQAIELPYAGDRLSMIVLLPRKGVSLAKMEQALTLESFSRWRASMHQQEVHVFLPKFKTTQRFLLNDSLETLGIKDAFEELKADFSGMTGRRNLYISKVIHKAFVDVSEEGTEAAAATATGMLTTRARPFQSQPVFRADHPFIFTIIDKQPGTILFLGRIMNPKQE
jgi:serpin B